MRSSRRWTSWGPVRHQGSATGCLRGEQGEGEQALAVSLGGPDTGQQRGAQCFRVGDSEAPLESGGGDGDAGSVGVFAEAEDVTGDQGQGGGGRLALTV